ncbi:flagellin lysine-N-methylase [Clostridium estertheticum]|uniref:flagellin lysine-N-methylase n=1 Tax=Clostridium estertheticum TaxID=238834 RepID=UPI001CF2F11C|nr:flagellin lysine-N-methylase [Clostridium estertheticum]MCB2308795.1 flagellin lysine-N-methylase [Clostridium estertheticum]MCB2347127.1 flagellin lysine-N-methylase [Clostridium estertheticum]MCB2351781.1 flagellin lysine-N-methylase [Clostridium estertheticum]WAG44497.1 flagellin lysine-N-methylase [Clostridium estertheticum]
MSKKRIVLMPQYLSEFNCIGDKCEDNCCYGWNVAIDKNIYEKYRKVSDKDLKKLLDKNVKRNRANPSKDSYAKIKMNDSGQCPFINENKLCNIHKELGSKYLSKVCATYPRETNLVDNKYERAATLSCPEISRLVLLNKELMEFDEIEESDETQTITKYIAETKGMKDIRKAPRYFWELRMFAISLVQNRKYTLWERLIILGLFMQKVSEYINIESVDKIPGLIQEYNEIIDSESLKQELSNIPINLNIQMELMKEISDQRFDMNINGNMSSYINCVMEFLQGVKYTEDDKVEDIGERYEEAFNNYYKPFMDEHEYVLENYVVNYIFKEVFPILSKGDVFQDYVKLIVNYSYIKMLLIGMSGFNKKLDEAIIVRVIYSFSRAVEHNKVFLDNIYNIIKVNGFDTMPYMAILIKN